MNSYKCLTNNHFSEGSYNIVPFREEDIYIIKNWRNEQLEVLRQKKVLTDADQDKYYREQILPTFDQEFPKMLLFSYLLNNELVGYGGLTNIDWDCKRAEMSFLVDTNRTDDDMVYKKDLASFVALMKNLIFEELQFNRLFTETYDIRPLHISVLEENGLRPEGRMKEHIIIKGNFVDSLIHGCLKSYYESER